MQEIITAVCKYRDVEIEKVVNYDKYKRVYFTRYMIWHYLHCIKGVSVGKLSKMFNRNKPSIFRGIRLLKHQIKYDYQLRAEYHAIVEKLEGMTKTTPSENM